jgi:ABC-type Na+ transport system ATPase subunit NatA
VDGIDFELVRGEAFGFLGPNGAGKSSTMRILGCVSPPTLGDLTILGGDPVRDGAAIRARLGVVPQEDTLDNELTVRENLLVYGRYFGLPCKLINERTSCSTSCSSPTALATRSTRCPANGSRHDRRRGHPARPHHPLLHPGSP